MRILQVTKMKTKWTNFILVGIFFTIFITSGDASPFLYDFDDFENSQNASGPLRHFRKAAVVSDSPPCAKVAKDIMAKGGKIADAAIGGLVCMGATQPHTSGIGGGFVALYYNAKTKKSTVINARERAPLKATENMYDNQDEKATKEGGLAIACPGEVKGYMELYERFGGKMSWEEIFAPSIKFLTEGYKVSPHMAQALEVANENKNKETGLVDNRIERHPNLKEVFMNPRTNKIWKLNDVIREKVLAQTLKQIAKSKGADFYDPSSKLNQDMMKELKKAGSILTTDDFKNYKATITEGQTFDVDGLIMHSPGAPASGSLMTFLFRCLLNYKSKLQVDDPSTIHLYTECLKHTYGRRRQLGDPEDSRYTKRIEEFSNKLTDSKAYLNEALKRINPSKTNPKYSNYQDSAYSKQDSGTAQFVILGADGDALSITTTINTYFGSSIRSADTGVIFNDQMDDFLSDKAERKANPTNSIKGGKRPSTSASPLVFTDKSGTARLVIGGAGGVRILSAVSTVAINNLWFDKSIGDAIESRRFHHVMDPDPKKYHLEIEKLGTQDRDIKKWKSNMEKFGHKVQAWAQRTVVLGITKDSSGGVGCAWDSRKPGSADGF